MRPVAMLAKALPNSLPCTHQPSIKRLSTRVSAASSTSERSNHCRPLSVSHTATYERILRYPDGKERRIIYPLADPADPCEETCDTCFDETWESDHPWDVPGIPKDSSEAPPKAVTAPDQTQRKVSQLPSSPMELLRYLQSADYKAAQEANWQAVRDSYEVLHGCPWVLPRPVYVLAAARNRVADAGATYTLRTRVERKEAEGELTRVLKRTRADGSALIRVEQVMDGVVTFESEGDAQRYRELLLADGMEEVALMECDSHTLFRTVGSVKGAVVLLRAGTSVPLPEMLATSLRGQRSLDDL